MIVIIIILLLICCTLGGLIFLNKEKIFSEKNSATNKETQKIHLVIKKKKTLISMIQQLSIYLISSVLIKDVGYQQIMKN